MSIKPIPEGYATITPYLIVKGSILLYVGYSDSCRRRFFC